MMRWPHSRHRINSPTRSSFSALHSVGGTSKSIVDFSAPGCRAGLTSTEVLVPFWRLLLGWTTGLRGGAAPAGLLLGGHVGGCKLPWMTE